ncbi:hypothetical protein G6F38_008375 [Rhizopus arrhizus]|nr:hypothetical protein G6F38_008375 [Rhizopus arrhizus]
MENKTITEPPIVVVTHNDEPVEITSDESVTISDSSSTANTSLHDEYIPYYNQSEFQGPVIHHYRHKNILLTGATGFVGKAILWKLMQSLRQDIGHVYLLIRSGGNKRSKIGRPAERLKNEIFNNKAFVLLRQRMGKSVFDEIVEQKIIPVTGDIISPDLSLSQTDREQIVRHVQIVIHCAAALNYNERLDLTLETNTLGTLRVMDLADECQQMEAFIHTSLAYTDPSIPHGHLQERVYPMKLGDPEELLTEIVDLELKEIPKMTQRILAYYPNTYTFTKALTEHLIMKRVDINRVEEAQGGKKQWPVAIVRATQVGPAVFEPLPGWVDGVTGANGLIYLMGKGIQVLSTDVSRTRADIVPVDYFARVVISCAAELYPPGYKFILPYNEIVDEKEHDSILLPNVQYFPYIYQLSRPTYTWREIYEAVKTYWARNTPVMLPSAEDYFGSKLFKTSFFNKQKMPSSVASILGSSDAVNRTIELASRVARSVEPFLRHQWIWDHPNVDQLIAMDDPQFDLSVFDKIHPYTYAVNAAFGTHAYLSPSLPPLPALRKITLADGWYCSHFGPPESQHPLVDGPIESVVFSASEIERRTDRMVKEVMMALENPSGEVKEKKKLEVWMNDFDAFLDDWCHDDSEKLKNTEHMRHLGFWLHRPEGHEEHVRIEVLNDRRVGNCIKQIVESSGVPQKTVVGEALKILQRMRERTELHYIWSAGAFLHSLFGRLFTSLRVFEADLIRLRAEGENKNVVYVPICKSMTDQILVWYICLRYELPLPAIVCDEAMALLGPISDILRITGAYFVRRDLSSRSPLSTAVTAAYTEVLLSEHGALSMAIERTRSRTGRLQTAYHDGLINMVIEATVGKDHVTTPTDSLPTPTASFSSVKKDTVFVPVHITYEKIPELRTLIDQVLDQRSRSTSSLTSTTFLRPSATVADREALTKDKSVPEKGKYGRAFVAFGKAVDVKSSVQEASLSENKRQSDIPVKDEDVIADFIAKKIQKGQHEASIVSPVALTAATLLYGRIEGGITLGKLYQHVVWLHEELLEKKVRVDWQPDEDVQTIVAYAFHLLDARSNLVMDGKRMTEETVVRVVEHTDNVMDLSLSFKCGQVSIARGVFGTVYLPGAIV